MTRPHDSAATQREAYDIVTRPPRKDHTPWIIAGLALVALTLALLWAPSDSDARKVPRCEEDEVLAWDTYPYQVSDLYCAHVEDLLDTTTR